MVVGDTIGIFSRLLTPNELKKMAIFIYLDYGTTKLL